LKKKAIVTSLLLLSACSCACNSFLAAFLRHSKALPPRKDTTKKKAGLSLGFFAGLARNPCLALGFFAGIPWLSLGGKPSESQSQEGKANTKKAKQQRVGRRLSLGFPLALDGKTLSTARKPSESLRPEKKQKKSIKLLNILYIIKVSFDL
jgi:hypothetical protein